jgi:ABC-type sugar transport system ATPase subunit
MLASSLLVLVPAWHDGGYMTEWTLERKASLRNTGILMIEQMQELQKEVSVLHNEIDHLERLLVDKGLLREEEMSLARHKEFLEESFMRIVTDLKVKALKAGFLELVDGLAEGQKPDRDMLVSDKAS